MEAARDAYTVLAEMERVLGELEALVARRGSAASPPPASSAPDPSPPAPPLASPPLSPPEARPASLSAGPFAALDDVDLFGARLRDLEGVVDVVHTGFEGERALFDVRLWVPR